MKVKFNNDFIETESKFLIDLLREKNIDNRTGIAVAVNQQVIQKTNWRNISLCENDNVLVITATQGG